MESEGCPYCGQLIPEEEWHGHERGVDVKRLECPHQDLDEIVAARTSTDIADRVW